jgi:hypothetical protein
VIIVSGPSLKQRLSLGVSVPTLVRAGREKKSRRPDSRKTWLDVQAMNLYSVSRLMLG